MKNTIVSCLALLFCLYTHAQEPLFVRVYGKDQHLIAKGNIGYGTDSTITLFCRHHRKIPLMIPVSDVATIKTGRTFGHHILVGAVVGFGVTVTAVTISLTTTNDPGWLAPENLSEAVAGGTFVGLAGAGNGAIIGAVAGALSRRKTLLIDGDKAKWEKARAVLFNRLPVPMQR